MIFFALDKKQRFNRAIVVFVPFCPFKGSFNNYIKKWRWVGVMANVYAYDENDLSLFTMLV